MFSNRYRYFYIVLLGAYSFLNIKFTEGDKAISATLSDTALFVVIMSLTIAVWEVNHLIQKRTFKRLPRLAPKLIYRFVISIIFVLGLSSAASFGVGVFESLDASFPGFKQTLGFTFRINLFLHCINAIYQYNRALGDSRIEAEKLKKQSTEAKLAALKNQVNPHFLFNSLNILTSIIEEDSKVAVKYVGELSKVYRYLLKNENENLVPLSEELSFIESYLFLLQLRFNDNLIIEINIEDSDEQRIPPSTLQLLIENAIKHNEVSSSCPLKIKIYQQIDDLIVENNVKARKDLSEPSGLGLSNISNRYQLIASKKPIITHESDMFQVRLPVMKSTYEDDHNRR